MNNLPALSRGETEVLKALWSLEQGGVGEIHAALPKKLEMDYSTTQTYVRRLEAKGYIESQRVGRNKSYHPAVRRKQVLGEAIDEFIDRMFDGQMLPMFRHMVDSREISSDELNDLMRIVEQLKQEHQDDFE